jgi:hypothetical protein
MSEAAIPIPATRKIPSFRLPVSATSTIRVASDTIRKANKETKPDDFTSLKSPASASASASATAGGAAGGATATATATATAAEPTQKRKTVRIKGAPIDLEKAKTEIRAIESDNPYREKKQVVFPLQTRLSFQDDIYELYSSFEAKRIPESAIDYNACDKIAAGLQSSVEMYEYQKFVREYMRQASPYRGLLVYHGLGSGKTCSAIAAAEAIFSVDKKKIIVMTPFSLRDNFIREVSFCGFQHYRMENYWEKLESSRDDWEVIVTFAADVLGLPESYLRTAKTIWVPEFDLPSNIESLSGDDKEQIQKQIQAQIQARITFINYNGISAKELKRYACEQPDIFDDAVIIVDEMHNLTRLMQGTIEPYLSNLQSLYQKRRKVQVEPVTHNRWKPSLCDDPSKNYKRGYMLYRLLVGAKGSKIIGLSGTPLINFPEEVAILMNLLGGYIHTSSLYILSPVSDAQIKTINTMLQENEFIDYVEVKRDGKNTKVFLTMVPEGMKKIDRGVTRAEKSPSFDELVKTVQAELEKMGFSTATPTFHSEPILPPIGDEFRKYFLDDKDDSRILNKLVIRKRIQGLISYYKGSKKELMPLVVKDELVRVPFSPYVHSQYCSVRVEELNASRKKSDSGDVPGIAGKMGSLWAELYGLASSKSSPSYRMYSRQVGTFAFPKNVRRPRPTREQVGEVLDLEVEAADEIVVERDDMPTEEETALAKEIGKEEDATDLATVDSASDSASALSEVLVLDQPPPEVATAAATAAAPVPMSSLLKEREQFKKNCLAGSVPGGTYSDAIRESKRCLRVFAKDSLTLLKRDGSPNPLGLSYHSPKYAEMLRRILESPGSNLVYSQFLEMEGIGIFLEVLKAQGFEPLEISADGKNFSAETIKNLSGRTDGKDPRTIKRFLSFTGGETREKRTMALRVFNAKYDAEKLEGTRFKELPRELSAILESSGFTGNLKGELCSVFCITSAGAEGLSLRNVRRVHIMEPYWNHVRTDQVKGRAVRICSHVDLQYNPEPSLNERTVEVFTYCSVFHPDALRSGSSGSSEYVPIPETLLNDGYPAKDAVAMGFPVPEGVKDYVPTSDEYLYMLSQKKKTVLQSIQNLMKQSAIDCKINLYENEEDGLGCIALDGGFKEYAFHPLLKQDIILTKEEYPDDEATSASASASAAPSTTASASAPTAASNTESAEAYTPTPAPASATATKSVIRGIRMKSPDGREVYAYPEDGRVPALSYILYQWDDSFYRKNPDSSSTVLGRTGAKKDGSISSVGLTWSS